MGKYQWTWYPNRDMPVGYDLPGNRSYTNHDEHMAVKREVQQHGYSGFCVEEGKAYIKRFWRSLTATDLQDTPGRATQFLIATPKLDDFSLRFQEERIASMQADYEEVA